MGVVSTTTTVSIQSAAQQTALQTAAANLAPGATVSTFQGTLDLSLRNTGQVDGRDIQWSHVLLYHDSIRKELQYAGKPASSQTNDYSHYIYNETTKTWTTTLASQFGDLGHMWTPAFDHTTGDYYFKEYIGLTIRRYTRATGVWDSLTLPSGSTGNINAHGMAYHPNLFGPGLGGLCISLAFGFWTWNKATGVFTRILTSSQTGNLSTGEGIYIPGLDRVMIGTGNNATTGIILSCGAGPTSVSNYGMPPNKINGGGGGDTQARFVMDPNNDSRVLLLEGIGSRSVWATSDAGATWSGVLGTHPFTTTLLPGISDNQYTIASLPAYGVIMGMTSGHGNGGLNGPHHVALWKPNL